MTANSYSGNINTADEFVTVESVATGENFSGFTASSTYSMYVSDNVEFKVGDAVIPAYAGERFTYTAGADDLYIRTQSSCTLSILEN